MMFTVSIVIFRDVNVLKYRSSMLSYAIDACKCINII